MNSKCLWQEFKVARNSKHFDETKHQREEDEGMTLTETSIFK